VARSSGKPTPPIGWSAIADPSFRAAVDAIHAGDVLRLEALLDAEPRLLHERNLGPEAYRKATRHQYFRDPKLFWFAANNPNIARTMPENTAEVAQAMIARGVAQSDLDYTLELTVSSASASEHGVQLPLVRELLAAGAKATPRIILTAAAQRGLEALRALLEAGEPMTLTIASALGDIDRLRDLIARASAQDVQIAFAMATLNGHLEAATIALDAGADVNAFFPYHAHMTALHQAASNDSAAFVELLLARGARTDTRDTMWDATPLAWAAFLDKPAARAALEGAVS